METVSFGIENLCVPCHANCCYCLLSSCGAATGVDYERGKQLTRRLYREIKAVHPDMSFSYYIGYCMDTPHLPDYIQFCQEIGSPSGRFLQCNGLALRDASQTLKFILMIHRFGVKKIDLTFYGLKDYHDRFAGRMGDYDFLLRILTAANQVGLAADVSIPLIRDNYRQVDALLDILSAWQINHYFVFLPHGKGRGHRLEGQRLTQAEFNSLSSRVLEHFSKVRYQSEGQWLREDCWPEHQKRALILSLQPDNIDRLEAMPIQAILRDLEALDDHYYESVPPLSELARRYGDPASERVFRLRDLHLYWQKQFLAEYGKGFYDMNEERHHFSVHISY